MLKQLTHDALGRWSLTQRRNRFKCAQKSIAPIDAIEIGPRPQHDNETDCR
jgi:hypothetical protein